MKDSFVKYTHHKKDVWVHESVKGKHREYCLCFSCNRFNIDDREKNCPIANDLFELCVIHNITTPVFECPDFSEKVEG